MGRSRSLCPRKRRSIRARSDALLVCPLVPVTAFGVGDRVLKNDLIFTREPPQAELHSGRARLIHVFFSPERHFASNSFIPGRTFQNRRELKRQKAQ